MAKKKIRQLLGYTLYQDTNNETYVLSKKDYPKQVFKKYDDAIKFIAKENREEYASKFADNVLDNVLHIFDANIDNVHLKVKRRDFREVLEKELSKNFIDVSFTSTITNKYKIKISGNVSGIVSSYIYVLYIEAWKEQKFTDKTLKEHIKKKGIKVFKTDKYGELVPMIKENILKSFVGTQTQHMGYGSHASVNLTKSVIKVDKYNNLLLDRWVEVWD